MDRQSMLDQASERKANAALARAENRLWDAMTEEAMYFQLRCKADHLNDMDRSIQAQLTFGFTMMRLRLSPQTQKDVLADIRNWAKDGGTKEMLTELLKKYQ